MTRGPILVTLVIAGALGAGQGRSGQGNDQQGPAATGIHVEKVRDNLYILSGGGGNTAAFVTAKGVVLVDTKLPGWGRPILEKLKEITDKQVTIIINTHSHFDHVSGNIEFPATVEVVTQENTARQMHEIRAPTGVANAPQENIFNTHNGAGLPKRTFKDQLTLGSGDDRVELHHFGPAHTSGDTFVVFPALRAMHAGDAFPNTGIPIIDANNGGSGVQYAETLAKAGALKNIDTVITGHNGRTLTMKDMQLYADFNREFVEEVRAAKKAGRTIDDVASTWRVPARYVDAGYTQPPPGTSGQGTARLRMNIEIVWNELK